MSTVCEVVLGSHRSGKSIAGAAERTVTSEAGFQHISGVWGGSCSVSSIGRVCKVCSAACNHATCVGIGLLVRVNCRITHTHDGWLPPFSPALGPKFRPSGVKDTPHPSGNCSRAMALRCTIWRQKGNSFQNGATRKPSCRPVAIFRRRVPGSVFPLFGDWYGGL